MNMPWFAPVGIAIGALGTRTAHRSRRTHKASTRDSSWWLLLVISWLPALCWILAQIVDQY